MTVSHRDPSLKKRPPPDGERGLQRILDAFAAPVVVKDRRHRWVMLNEAYGRLIGRARGETIGKSDHDFFPKEQADASWKADERVFKTGRENTVAEALTDGSGTPRTVSTTRTLLVGSSGETLLVGVIHDVTEHQRMLEELRLKNSLLAAQNEASITGILVVDDAGRILDANRRFAEMWGISDAVLATGSDERALEAVLAASVDSEKFMDRVRHLYRHRDEKSREEIALRDGRTFDRYSAPVVGPDGRYYGRVWYFRDITELRKVEALKAEIKQRRELDVLKDQFIGTVSHELRTPLTIVRAAVESLRNGLAGKLSGRQQEIADLCHRNILRLNKMISNLLDISRLESGRAKARVGRLDLKALLADMEANFRMMGQDKRVALSVDAPATLPNVRADPELIAEVLYNLLDNAVRFARHRVRVNAVAERGTASGQEVPGVRIEVVDDGPGIPPDRIGLLFNKFTQVARSIGGGGYKGTGLGLAICREIAALHGTAVFVDSRPGQGARFHFFLPEWRD
jgi:PAS domain S-box-containing protein